MHRTVQKVLRAIGFALVASALFVVAVVASVLLHLDLPLTRRVAASTVNSILAPSFKGRIEILSIDRLGLFGLDGASVRLIAPGGKTVVRVDRLRGHVATLTLLRSLLHGRGPLRVPIGDLAAGQVEASLDTDDEGQLLLARALAPRNPPTEEGPPGRGLRLTIGRLSLGHVHVHGAPGGAAPFDADVDELRGTLLVAPDLISADLERAALRTHGLLPQADLRGILEAHVRKPSLTGRALGARAVWRGELGAAPVLVDAAYDDPRVDASVDVPFVEPEALRALATGLDATEPARAHAELHGTKESFTAKLDAAAGDGSLEVRGAGRAAEEKDLRLSFRAGRIDLHALHAPAPRSSLDASGDAEVKVLPSGALMASADVRVHEPGADARLGLRAYPVRGSTELAFDLAADAPRLAAVEWLKGAIDGSARLEAHGTYDVAGKRIDARAHALLENLARAGLSVQRTALALSAAGKLPAPDLQAALTAHELTAGSVRITDLAATTLLDISGPLAAHDVAASLARKNATASLTVGAVHVGGGTVTVDDARLEGLGAPLHARLHITPETVIVRARAPDIDLARVARVFGLEDRLSDGRVALDVDVVLRRDGGEGRVMLDARECQLSKLRAVTAHVEASLEGRSVHARASARARDLGTVDLEAPSVEIGGRGPLSVSSWRRSWGSVDLSSRVNLAKLAELVPAGVLPVSHARGTVVVHGHIARDAENDFTPDLVLSAATEGLVLEASSQRKRDPTGRVIVTAPAWHTYGTDFALDAHVDGTTGFTELSARVNDPGGVVVGVDAKSASVPYGPLIADAAKVDVALRTMPFGLRLVVPRRKMKSFPRALDLAGFRGDLEVNAELAGPLADPVLSVHATNEHRRSTPEGNTSGQPVIDAELDARYQRSHLDAAIHASEAGRVVLDAELGADGSFQDLLAGAGQAPDWSATARAHFDAFPLASVGLLADREVEGRISGEVTLTGLHEDAAVAADLDVAGLKVGDSEPTSGHVRARVGGQGMQASLHLEQKGGAIDLDAQGGSSWGRALAPSLDTSQPLEASLSAKSFQLAIVQPFVQAVLPEFSARLDGTLRASVDPRAKTARFEGNLAVADGRIEPSALGSELHDIAAKVSFASDGTVRLEELEARGMSGRVVAKGTAKMSGFELSSADAQVEVPDKEAFPLTLNGVELGTVVGRVDLEARRAPSGHELDVRATIPELHVTLPETPSRNIPHLGPIEDVHLGVRRNGSEFVLVPLGPGKEAEPSAAPGSATVTRLTVKLGDDVLVTRTTDIKVALGGSLDVVLDPATRVTGALSLRRGYLFVQGRRFEIEKGSVTFVGDDPSNPQVVVTAGWTAPDGTRVYADFVGPLKTGKVNLRSEPPLPKNEVLALIVFGSPDTSGSGNATTGSTPTAASAAGIVGGEAAQPVNHFFQQMGISGVITKVDTSTANPRPEVEVQIARDISLQIAQVLGTPPLANPDTTLLTVDWRFSKRWSMETTVGNLGSSIFDLVWTHRY